MIFLPMFHLGIKACMEANHPVDEEPYEVDLDNHGCRDGPRTGRLRASTSVSFSQLNITLKINELIVRCSFLEDSFYYYVTIYNL